MAEPLDMDAKINLGSPIRYASNQNAPLDPQTNAQGSSQSVQNTLDEPVWETIKRDLRMIAYKLKYVMHPRMRQEAAKELRNWDLWGPLLLCLALAFVLSLEATEDDDTIFGTIFVIIWGGASVLTLNAKFLGGKISFFQSLCVLGYCIFPILLAAIVNAILGIVLPSGKTLFGVYLIICTLACVWSVKSSIGFIQALVVEKKRMLASYPVILFYLALTWFVLLAASGGH